MKVTFKELAACITMFLLLISSITIAPAVVRTEDRTASVEEFRNSNYFYSELIEISSSEETTTEIITTTEQATIETTAEIITASKTETTTEQITAERTTVANRTPKSESIEKYLECPENLKYYMAKNSEVYAYIYLPGTGISYPVMRSRKDDLFYLDNDWMGNADKYGSIFTQSHNSKNFSDPVTVVYGHNYGNGKMFSNLHNYKNREFFEENDLIIIYTQTKTFIYKIFSAFTFDDRHIMNTYDFSNPRDLADYQNTLTKAGSRKNIADDVTVGKNSKIVTLSTCGEPHRGCDTRYLVSGVLIDTVAN